MAAGPPLPVDGHECCLFLDFDGTLVELAATPDAVAPDPALVDLLDALSAALGGALAIVSGRQIATLDRLLAPLVLPAAGLHGIERRRADGTRRVPGVATPWMAAVREELRGRVARQPGLLLEDKDAALAVHYRAAPALRESVHGWLRAQPAVRHGDAEILEGECLLEIRPAGRDKGTAVEEFLAEPPFAGRRPVFAGDDLADAAGLEAARRRGGLDIAVGARLPARWRLEGPAEVRRWLHALLARVRTP